jgi:hypothetical protein
MFGRGNLECFWFREGGNLASIGQGADGALVYGDRFRLGITFAAGFEKVVDIGGRVECAHADMYSDEHILQASLQLRKTILPCRVLDRYRPARMKLTPVINAIGIFSLTAFERAQAGTPISQKEIDYLETQDGAKPLIQSYFAKFDMRLIDWSPFVEKTFGKRRYLIARAEIYWTPHAASQNLGVVIDESNGVLQGLIDDNFRQFVRTGDSRYLKSLNLNPND